VVSLLTRRPAEEKLVGLTYATVAKDPQAKRTWGAWDVVHTLIILAVIACVYVYFRG